MTADSKRGTRKRVIAAALLLVGLQAIASAIYFQVERGREARERDSFPVETLSDRSAAPELVMQTAHGSERGLRASRGKTILVHFWATWCAPCKAELPQLLELGRRLERQGRFELVAVAVNDDWSSIRTFFAGRIPASIYRDANGAAARALEVSVLPDSYVLDAQGAKVARIAGARDWSSARAREAMARWIANGRASPD